MRVPIGRFWHLLHHYLSPQRGRLALLAALLLGSVVLRLSVPLLAAAFVNRVVGGETELRVLVLIALAICAAGVLDQVCVVSGNRLGARVSWTATNRLREDLVATVLRQDMEFHHEHGPGHLVERVDGDCRELTNFFAEFAVRLAVNLVVIVGVLGVLTWADWRIGLAYFVVAVLACLIFYRARGVASPHWHRTRQDSAALYGEVQEWFEGLPDLRANGALPYARMRFAAGLRRMFHSNRKAMAWSIGISTFSGMVLVLGATAVLALATALFVSGAVSVGVLVALLLYSRIINRPLEEIVEQVDDLQRATASIERVGELLATRPGVRSGLGIELPSGPIAVAFDGVTFGYPRARADDDEDERGPALQDVSFTLRPGEVLGLIGRTGSGKSTVTRLLLRFYDPSAGTITLGGHDIRDATLEQLRHHIGVVSQEVQLFHASVRDNLTMFAGGVADDRLAGLLREIGLGDWYDRLPDGLDTVLPAGGGGLSAGQAQLLAAVRIFVADPGLVLLDEPTSRLDPAAEQVVRRAFERLLAGRTAIVVAHRMSTISHADTVLVLEHGRVVEHGDRVLLDADPGSAYHRVLALASTADSPLLEPEVR